MIMTSSSSSSSTVYSTSSLAPHFVRGVFPRTAAHVL